MSTRYYHLRDPWTRIQVSAEQGRCRVQAWRGDMQDGDLIFPVELAAQAVLHFAAIDEDRDDRTLAARRVGCGSGRTALHENTPGLHPDTQLISDRGEVVTVGRLRAETGTPPDREPATQYLEAMGLLKIELHRDIPSGGWIANAVELEMCSTYGDTPEEALAELPVAAEAWLTAAAERTAGRGRGRG